MKISKGISALALTGVALTAAGLTLGVSAFGLGFGNEKFDDSLLVSNIAEAFNVSTDEVIGVFENTREMRHNEHLNQLVEEGVITEIQKELLEEKHEEMELKKEEIFRIEMSVNERKDALQQLHTEMQEWAEANGIELPMKGPREGFGKGHHGGAGMNMYKGF